MIKAEISWSSQSILFTFYEFTLTCYDKNIFSWTNYLQKVMKLIVNR